ncbi:MAG: hypothetical protein Q9181_007103 [Wetmoreana brouardii]
MARRISDKELRIKEHSLKEHIMERLIEGAEGMFRWVACQMDYLCELPNDAARRKALNSLPPTLNATYERILQKVNESTPEVQRLVQRSLFWIIHEGPFLTTSALCEVVAIEPEHRRLEREAIPEEEEILHRCSSLLRRSASGDRLELAHFTVKEFLTSNDIHSNSSFCAYYVAPEDNELGIADIAKTYLTYILFEDFDSFDMPNSCPKGGKNYEYALWETSVHEWPRHASCHLDDLAVLHLVQKLFHPSKTNNFMNWAYQLGGMKRHTPMEPHYPASASPLHFAASLHLSEVCTWLVLNGSRVNENSLLGYPLDCVFWGLMLLAEGTRGEFRYSTFTQSNRPIEKSIAATVHALLDVGAEPSSSCHIEGEEWTPLRSAFYHENKEACVSLLRRGATIDEKLFRDLKFIAERRSFCKEVIDLVGEECLRERGNARLLEFAAESDTIEKSKLQSFKGLGLANADLSLALRNAAYSGQLGVIEDLVQDPKADVNNSDLISGSTALIESCKMDHVDVVRILLDSEADPDIMDQQGRMPLHYAVQAPGCQCLPILLKETANIAACDQQGNNVWHLAAGQGNTEALKMVMDHAQNRGGPTPIIYDGYRAQLSHTKHKMSENPGSPQDRCDECAPRRRNNDALTPLHFALDEGSSEAIKLLVAAGADPSIASKDGSSLLHYAVKHGSEVHAIVDALVEVGVDPCISDKNGDNPLHTLMTVDILKVISIEDAKSVVQTLAERGAKIDQSNAEGLTPLHLICRVSSQPLPEDWDVVSWEEVALESLLYLSADLYIRDSDGQTPVDILIQSWEEEYVTAGRFKRAPVTARSQICAALMRKIVDHCSSGDASGIGLVPWSAKLLFLALWLKEDTLARAILGQQPDVEANSDFVELSPIQGACLYGCSRSLLRRLLEASSFRCNPTAVGVELMRVLCQNPEKSNDGNILELLCNGYDPNGRSSDGTTALMMAAKGGKLSFVETLLRYGAEVCAKNCFGWNAAHYACNGGRKDILYALHKTNIGWNDKVRFNLSDYESAKGNSSMLHIASSQGDSKVVEFLLRKHLVEDIDSTTDCGETALHIASFHGEHINVGLLLDANADYTIFSKKNESPLHVAAKLGHLEVVEAFVSRNCQTRLPNAVGLTPELYARKYGHREVVEFLKDQRIKEAFGLVKFLKILLDRAQEHVSQYCRPIHPLHLAVMNNHLDCVKLLLEDSAQEKRNRPQYHVCGEGYDASHLANLRIHDQSMTAPWQAKPGLGLPRSYYTAAAPLHLAASEGNVAIARLILTHWAFVDCTDAIHDTPLHKACEAGHKGVVRLLLDSGANPNSLNGYGQSASHLAASAGCLESLKMLIDAGADLGLQDSEGYTALHTAASSRAVDAVVFLISQTAGYKLGLETSRGVSALDEILSFAPSFILNLAPSPDVYEGLEGNVLSTIASRSGSTKMLKRFLRRIPKEMTLRLLNKRHRILGTPLHAAVLQRPEKIGILLDAGADPELDGSEHGTPLMVACAVGRLSAVKYLIARGAKTSYVRDGQVFSVLKAAKLHPRVVRWLLVGRFMELKLLANGSDS